MEAFRSDFATFIWTYTFSASSKTREDSYASHLKRHESKRTQASWSATRTITTDTADAKALPVTATCLG
ncbi:hypothetical protein SNOG_03631 [Parastagonospora nodorum SN15]|uniref:Uncharacterized protein n=1 Tax=Phaeosphaeria nodorum (strain SN15 / ATCC MYA-4574 / FGSC 10173) TaxID=321614 RepID=Q0UX83_PHANO|nr:hypothetical protein SNOG_03631 [Parastagonospora nodorum SN15]EAT88836.1 hypothetical protein SNOG_03631 [Parastagonospora nodorum SN15]